MKTYQAYCNFTAQGPTVSCLLSLFASIEKNEMEMLELPIVVFMAFSIESYVNSLGFRKLENWPALERKPWKDKIDLLHKNTGSEASWNEGQLQFAKEIFALRDKLAHGKPASVKGKITTEYSIAKQQSDGDVLQPAWFKKINRKWLIQSKNKYLELMKYLAILNAFDTSDYLNYAEGAINTVVKFPVKN